MLNNTGKKNKTGQSESSRTSIKPPQLLSAASGDISGEINLIWEPVKGAKTYIVQKSTALNRWIQEDIITRSRYTISKLKSGKKYRFRIAAVDSRGQGPWSKPVEKNAP